MITQEIIDLVKERLRLPNSVEDCKIDAMEVLLDSACIGDTISKSPFGNLARIDLGEARLLVDAIHSEMAGLILLAEREQMLLDELKGSTESLKAANDCTAKLKEQNRHLASFIIDIISTGSIGVC